MLNKCLTLIILASLSQVANAHGFAGSGWLHPLTGIDHMCAMIAVGAWSAQLGGRAIWAVPTAFVCSMLVGGILGFNQIMLQYTEFGIALSVLLLGLAIALECKFGIYLAILGVGIFGLCHGWAHGYEIPSHENKITYALGFIITTACLHILGVVATLLMLEEKHGHTYLRLCGLTCTIVGTYLLF